MQYIADMAASNVLRQTKYQPLVAKGGTIYPADALSIKSFLKILSGGVTSLVVLRQS